MTPASRPFWKTFAWIPVVAGVYFAAGRFGLSLAALHANVSFVWPAAGLALASLLIGGYGLWPGVFLGALLVNAATDIGWPAALGIAAGNTLEAVLGVFLLRRVAGFQNGMERLRDGLSLIVFGGLTDTAVAATVGVVSLCLGGSAAWPSFGSLWLEWWIGDMLGVLVVAPFLLAWSRPLSRPFESRSSSWKRLEASVLFLLLIFVVQGLFEGWLRKPLAPFFHPYMLFPLLIWAAIRFGQKGATAATLIVSLGAVWGTFHGLGPFAGRTPYEGLLSLQLFMAAVIPTTLVLAATIAERKRSESVKSEFASMVSHELRTPLSSIKAGIEVVLDGIDGPVTDAQRETLDIAKNNVNRLTRLINNVLDYSKLESGKLEMIFEKTDVTQILREIYDLMKPAVQNKGLDFLREFPDAPFLAVCDADKIKQVLINLLDNAIKFTDAGGTISLHLRRSDRQVLISVEDTGVGIPEEDQERIFEMFGHASGRSQPRGTGIGLSVCRLVVGHHRGRIDVDSSPGEGTRLTVVFPDSLPERMKTVTLRDNR